MTVTPVIQKTVYIKIHPEQNLVPSGHLVYPNSVLMHAFKIQQVTTHFLVGTHYAALATASLSGAHPLSSIDSA